MARVRKPVWISWLELRLPSIFARIYVGVLVACVLAAWLGWNVIRLVDGFRYQEYRETMASGAAYLLQQGWQRQPSFNSQVDWLTDVGQLLGTPLEIVKIDAKAQLSSDEITRLRQNKPVFQTLRSSNTGNELNRLYAAVPGQPDYAFTALVSQFGEQQVKAVVTLLLDDLSAYRGPPELRLAELQPHLPYPVTILNVQDAQLNPDQVNRLWQREPLVVFGNEEGQPVLRVVATLPAEDRVLKVGPIPLFNWLPAPLALAVTLLVIGLIGLCIYSLILPLERKIRGLQVTVHRVRLGDMTARVEIEGRDEIDQLGRNFNNMTDHIQRLIEAQRELTRAVSHELRTPIARVRFAVEMLVDTDDSEMRWEQQADIERDIDSLNLLIDEVLTYAKLEEGPAGLEFNNIRLDNILNRAATELRAMGRECNVQVYLAPMDLRADAEERYLLRMVQNLCGNAIRHARSLVRISAGMDENYVFISVEDDGDGIAVEDREKIFLPFARLDSSRNRSSGGYGMGLSIVSRIAYWFRGTVIVDHSPQLGGARFTIRWPQRRIR